MRGLQLRVPVHQPLVAIDQPFAGGARRTPCAPRADRPSSMVKRSRLQSGEAPSARSWRVMVPPDSAFHCQTRSMNVSRPELRGGSICSCAELPLHHHLRGDAGMVGARLPQRVAALHALIADQHVLQREGQRVAHVQAARDVGRRHHDGVGRRARLRMRGERARALPGGIDRRLDLGRAKGLVEFWARQGDARAQRPSASRTSRAISSRTSRSTSGGRLSSSQVLSIGRSSSRTMSSSVRSTSPSGNSGPLVARTADELRQRRDRRGGAGGRDQPLPLARRGIVTVVRRLGLELQKIGLGAVRRRRLGNIRHRLLLLDHFRQFEHVVARRLQATRLPPAARRRRSRRPRLGASSSSAMMRRMEARISSIDGSCGPLSSAMA